jgi:hypothetical protein
MISFGAALRPTPFVADALHQERWRSKNGVVDALLIENITALASY